MKARTKKMNSVTEEEIGDAWCFIGMERHTKLILAWHLGEGNITDTEIFTEKLAYATKGNFQVNTDGFKAYKDAIIHSLGTRVDFSQIIKKYGKTYEGNTTRYSPAKCIGCDKVSAHGQPNLDTVTTSHIERQNLTVRMSMRRMTRLTNAFSKKWDNLRYAYALQFAYYNFCRVHTTIKVTPAMESDITDHVWTIEELVTNPLV